MGIDVAIMVDRATAIVGLVVAVLLDAPPSPHGVVASLLLALGMMGSDLVVSRFMAPRMVGSGMIAGVVVDNTHVSRSVRAVEVRIISVLVLVVGSILGVAVRTVGVCVLGRSTNPARVGTKRLLC